MKNSNQQELSICCISNAVEISETRESYFSERKYPLNGTESFMLTDRINAENFRFRSSNNRYKSDWHVAGDPTLLIVLGGTIKIEVRSGESKIFSKGEMFIAEDFLPDDIKFDDSIHGHRAEVVGDEPVSVLHLKLDILGAGE